MSEFMKKRSFEITDIEKNSSQYPGICMDTERYMCAGRNIKKVMMQFMPAG